MRGERGGEREIKRETETLLENFEYFNDFSLKINWTKLEQKDNFKKITFRKQLLKISISFLQYNVIMSDKEFEYCFEILLHI